MAYSLIYMNTREAICLYCSKPIRKGRRDKKFCDSFCKDAFHNERKQEEMAEISRIDGILKRNRRVLKKLFESKRKEKVFSREEMVKEGFEFGFLTHIAVTRLRLNEITFCYDYGYRQFAQDRYEIFESFSSVKIKDWYEVQVTKAL